MAQPPQKKTPRGASEEANNNPEPQKRTPWWAPTADADAPLPDSYPQRPDIARVHALRQRLKKDKATETQTKGPLPLKVANKTGKLAHDIGSYTLIPTMMVAGPGLGYLFGWLIQKQWGGEPWPIAGGLLFGLAAAFRQIILLLKKKSESNTPYK